MTILALLSYMYYHMYDNTYVYIMPYLALLLYTFIMYVSINDTLLNATDCCTGNRSFDSWNAIKRVQFTSVRTAQ